MKRKISMLLVVVMLGVMLSGCSGEVTLESYTKDFLKVSEEYDIARGEFVEEINESMQRLSIPGVSAVSVGDAEKISEKLMDIYEKFEKMEPYPEVAEAHATLSEYYGAYATYAVDFANALDDGDFDSAGNYAYELESIDFDMAWAEIDMYDQLGIEVDF